MGYHTFAAGEVLTAANVNTYLMNQSVIVCTSGTRPSSPVAGMTIFETDTTNYNYWTGTVWKPLLATGTFTPTLTISTAVTLTTTTGLFSVANGICTVWAAMTYVSGGVSANNLVFGFPSPCPAPNASLVSGAHGIIIGSGVMDGFSCFSLRYSGSQTATAVAPTTGANYAPAWSPSPVWTLSLSYPV